MNVKILMRMGLLFFALMTAVGARAATYYVDFSSGADMNNGTSKTSPWQHAPGMKTCTNVCSSTPINAGDSVILKGGVTWPNASFQWSLPAGSTGNPVYVGVDMTWFTGSSWARPILSGGGAAIPNGNIMIVMGANTTLDNFEITGYFWNAASCTGIPNCVMINMGQTNGQTVENLYIHGWTHTGTNAATSNGVATGIITGGGGNSVAHDNVVVGTDVPGDHSLTAFYGGPPIAYNNYVQQVSSAFITGYATSVHDNYIADVGPAYCNEPFPANAGNCTHENGYEDNGDTGLNFYNNVVTDVSAGLALWLAPNPNYTVTAWNNVIYLIHDNQILDMAPPVYDPAYCGSGATGNSYCKTAGSYIFENNTVECGDDVTQYDQCQTQVGEIGSGSVATSFLYQNNHFITATTATGCYTGSGAALICTFAPSNIVQTLSTANSQGYNSGQAYAFSPTSSSNSTVGAGINLMSLANGILGSMASDTTYGVGYNPVSHTVIAPSRTSNSRPSLGAWDTGAYEYSSSSSQAPQPPTGLSAAVQ
jgi:hypothetical protein